MRKKKSKKSKISIKNIIKFIIIEVLLVCLLISVCFANRQHTEDNTEKIYTKVDSVEFPLVYSYYSSGRPIYLVIGNEKYPMYWHDRKKSYEEIVPDLLAEEEVQLTLAKSSLATFIFDSKMEIVDIRSENTVYYDVSITNQWNANNKTSGVVAVGFLLGAYTIIKLICFFFK